MLMARDILDEVQRLRAERRAFALATVVAARQPTSGMPGARAIIYADGEIEGWIGGQCAQPAVIRQGLESLADGSPRLVVLRPGGPYPVAPHGEAGLAPSSTGTGADAEAPAEPLAATMPGLVEVPMLCASQGELHVLVEPFLPKIELTVVGNTPAAQALARLAHVLDFEVWACDPEADMDIFSEADRLVPSLEALAPQLTARGYVIVATMNAYDDEAVAAALNSPASYVGLVASQRRFAAVLEALRAGGVPDERLVRLRRPKGLPGGAPLRPAEIAFSVLAELIEARRQGVGRGLEADVSAPTPERAEAIDPICGMTVDIATARYTSMRDGQAYYFCCAGCKRQFEAATGA
jgi:xanthine dehydrogenase accessory factor